MKALKKGINVINRIEDWFVIAVFSAMVVVVMAIVLCRYVFHIQFIAGEEIARYLMIWSGYIGASMAFRTHSHVGVVVFAEKLPKAWQPIILKLRHIISTIVLCGLFYVCVMCFNQYLESGKMTVTTNIPTAFVYVIIPIALALGIVHTIEDIIADYRPEIEETDTKEVDEA
ncbi:MAG: TRAP transporter small permease [Eubacterium sp.]|nr:TRAP transporter small permease [Eubacterium sp.]